MKRIYTLLLVLSLSACSSITKVEGDQLINTRMAVKLTDAWNKISLPGSTQPYEMWTQEGYALDQLRFWAGLKPGNELLVRPKSNAPAGQKAARLPTFAAGMAPDQLVRLFEELHAIDGSLVQMTKVEPTVFSGEKGFRFEFNVTRKSDDVQLRGVGWVAVRNQEMFAATFVAPRLSFFPRLLPLAESVVASAQIKG